MPATIPADPAVGTRAKWGRRTLTTAVSVQRRTGGNLVDVLQQMSHTLRERLRIRAEVRVITTAPRVSGYVVGLLPLAMLGMLYVVSRHNFDVLVTEPVGRMAMVASAVMVIIGLFINRRIASVDF